MSGTTTRWGNALLPIRLVSGWMFFSAFHRRVVLETGKLTPTDPGYIGEKFNQFMPGSILGVGDMIAWLLDHPDALHAFVWFFTIIEALVGLALIFGLLTRFSAFGMTLLSAGILFGAGWLGPTCLDEWQIGAVGIASGSVLMLGGAGTYSLDELIRRHRPDLYANRFVRMATTTAEPPSSRAAIALASIAFVITLGTNQVFHGGVWGTLHNDSVRPRVDVLSAAVDETDALRIELERPIGPETYGSFVMAIRVFRADGSVVREYKSEAIASIEREAIDNRWLVKIRTGPHGLVVPLGGRAMIKLPRNSGEAPLVNGNYRIEIEDVSGLRFIHEVEL